jgi:hypothetical protein
MLKAGLEFAGIERGRFPGRYEEEKEAFYALKRNHPATFWLR